MTRITLGLLVWIVGGLGLTAATTPLYVNATSKTYTTPPQIDATAFENRSLFDVSSFSFFGANPPFETFNTLYFTNTGGGTMSGRPGFLWDHSYAGGRGRMGNWINRGLVTASTWAWVNATNIQTTGPGFLMGPRGIIHLEGDNVNISRSGVYAGARGPSGSFSFGGFGGFSFFGTNGFIPDGGVVDVYWASSSNTYRLGTLAALVAPSPSTPVHRVATTAGQTSRFNSSASLPDNPLSSGNYAVYCYTNRIFGSGVGSNFIYAVFVPTNAAQWGINVDVKFSPNNQDGVSSLVQFSAADYDPVFQQPFTNYVYLTDDMAFRANTNLFVIGNSSSGASPGAQTQRPNNYTLSRSAGSQFLFGSPTNAPWDINYLVSSDYLSNVVYAAYAAYSARLTITENSYGDRNSILSRYPYFSGLPINDLTNYPGRIEINAKKLNMDQVRMHSESVAIIKTDDLVGNKAPVVDAPYLSLDLTSTQSQLVVSNVVQPSVNRFVGDISAWSAIWLNASTNNGGTNMYYTYVMVLDHSLTLTQSVVLADLKLKATNVVISDSLTVGRSTRIQAQNLINRGNFTNSTTGYIAASNLVDILNFTNIGTISSQGPLIMGPDRATPFSSIVNYGLIDVPQAQFLSDVFINTNAIQTTAGSFEARAQTMSLTASNVLLSYSDVILGGQNLYASNSTITAGAALASVGKLVLDFRGTVADSGLASSNLWTVNDGFIISSVPQGDLLGTTIQSIAPQWQEVTHYTEARDLGVAPEGFANNFAIGHLVLDGTNNTAFRFSPSPGTTGRALYVDYLELANNATNYDDAITVDEGCVLYFANANISPTKLNHISNDRVRWVSTYAGPRSGTNVVYPGSITNYLNLALVTSADLDSDNDGVANVNDATPVLTSGDVSLSIILTNVTPRIQVPLLSWAVPKSIDSLGAQNYVTNSLEFVPNVSSTSWKTLTNYVSPVGAAGEQVTNHFLDLLGTNRMYRVRVHVQDP